MPIISRLKGLYLLYFSKPAFNRPIYQAIRRHRVRKILELGIGGAGRAIRMIEVARIYTPASEIRYTGIDLFEARPSGGGPGLTVKKAYRLLRETGAKIQLVPGDPFSGLAEVANGLGPTDLVVVSDGHDPSGLAKAWFYVPRLLHPGSLVFAAYLCPQRGVSFDLISLSQVERLAASAQARRAA